VYLATALFIHGSTRALHHSVGDFGTFLQAQGLPLGHVVAWIIPLTEIFGSLTMASGFFVRYLAGFFILELFAGILLVHWKSGWFVVGGGTGVMEYSVLLIVSLFTVLFADIASRRKLP
jgi:putative oxidoreductase